MTQLSLAEIMSALPRGFELDLRENFDSIQFSGDISRDDARELVVEAIKLSKLGDGYNFLYNVHPEQQKMLDLLLKLLPDAAVRAIFD